MNTIKNLILAALIEYHWHIIMRCRRKEEKMLEHGERLTSSRLMNLTKKIDYHGSKAFAYEDTYLAVNALD